MDKRPEKPNGEEQTPVKLIINLEPEQDTQTYKITLQIETQKDLTYQFLISTLVALVDDLITKSTQIPNEQNNLQLEQSPASAL